jgi:hypothetical protein
LGFNVNEGWNRVLKLHEVSRGPLQITLEAGVGDRSDIAERLGLEAMSRFHAQILAKPWLDGLELTGRFEAVVEQICGVSLDPFEQMVRGELDVRIVPASSPHAPPPATGDLELDADGPDTPDVIPGDDVELAEYLIEHLSLELDPFPRKPGATFDYDPPADIRLRRCESSPTRRHNFHSAN